MIPAAIGNAIRADNQTQIHCRLLVEGANNPVTGKVNEIPQLDPFLLLDCFHSDNRDDYKAGFPWHPHRGMETITYVLDGEVEHKDSLGNAGVINPGLVFDLELPLAEVAEGYAAMHERRAVKTLLRP